MAVERRRIFPYLTLLTMHKLCGFWVQFRPKPATGTEHMSTIDREFLRCSMHATKAQISDG
jgi:hypothetical protein